MTPEELARKLLADNVHGALATSCQDKPWSCNVHFAYDGEMRIYWHSRGDRQHSHNVAQNPHAALAVAKQYKLFEGPVSQVTLYGRVARIQGKDEIAHAHEIFTARFSDRAALLEQVLGSDDVAGVFYYRLVPEEIVVFSNEYFPDNPRQVVIIN